MPTAPRARSLFQACAPLLAAWGLAAAAAAQAVEAAGDRVRLSPMTYVASEGAHNHLVLAAARADYALDGSSVALEGVEASIAAAPGVTGFELRSRRGRVDLETSNFDAYGDVRARTRGGRWLRTTRLVYDHARGVVSTEAPVEIQDATGTYRGRGFRYHVRDGRFQLLGGASVASEEAS